MAVAETASRSEFEKQLHDLLFEGAKMRNAPGGRSDRIRRGVEPVGALRVSLIQQYFHTLGFTNALRYLYARCGDPKIRDEIADGLMEEETGSFSGTASHIELFLQLAEAFDLPREKLRNEAYMVPEMGAIVHWYHYAATALPIIEGVAVLNFASEGQNVDFEVHKGSARVLLDALTKHYGKSGDALVFSTVHATADQEHAATGARLLAENVTTREEQERIKKVIMMTFDVWRGTSKLTEYPESECWKYSNSAFYL